MAIAGREQGAGNVNREVELRAGRQVARVDVASALGRRQHVVGPGFIGRDTHGSAKRLDRDVDVVPQLCRLPIAQIEIADVGVGEVGGQQSEPWEQGSPAPRAWLQLQDLDLEDIARLCAFYEHRPTKWVQVVEIQGAKLGRVVTFLKLARGDLFGVEMDDVSRLDLHRGRQRGGPLVVEGGAPGRVL